MDLIQRHFHTIDSTNTWAKQHAHELPQDKLTLVTADGQTAGRGRFKRRWESPSGQNIYASYCFFREKYSDEIGNIPQILAISAGNVLKSIGMHPTLKWPNDVLVSDKKIAGILAETTTVDKLCVIVGIGLNVNMTQEIAQRIDRPATSLLIETGKSFDHELILDLLSKEFMKNLLHFLDKGFASFIDIYRSYMTTDPDTLIRFHDNRRIWEGTFQAINDDGSFSLKLPDGELKTFIAGEILWPGE